ncbi:MAG: FAD-dependent oxidoreductase [Oscillospiraceae bacterium]|nr:FAD-dependent oxidoreductase [Oscillospiraceae bacterium]
MAYQIQQEFCSCCHRCKIVCPVGAVRFKNAKYWIDPERCIDCGACAKSCHNCVITQIGAEPVKSPVHEPVRRDCDLVVVGSGGSGLACAVKAAHLSGKKVVVLEKSAKVGGNTWYAGGFRIYYSKLHEKAGVPDTREEDIRNFLLGTLWQEDPQLVKRVFYGIGDFVDWMIESCDCEKDFVLRKHRVSDTWSVALDNQTGTQWKRIDASIGPGGGGSFVIEKLMKQAERLGVEVLTSHSAQQLLTDESGAVTGVIARDPGGITEFHAKQVVLATGCFSYNEELLRKTCPTFFDEGEPIHRFSVPTCTGDGIAMASAVGADIDYENTQALILGPAHHPYAFSLVSLIREPETLMVDANGRRFASEQDNTMGLRKLMPKLPGRYCWAIMDSHMLEVLSARLMEHSTDGSLGVEIISHYKEDLAEEVAWGEPVKTGGTLAELANEMGVEPELLTATVERYNQHCRSGYDADFFKDPRFLMPLESGPYYAMYCKAFQENAVGGMKINSDLQVLRPDGTPIPHLYAVGDNTRGVRLAGDLGPDLVERTISNLTWCLASGYIAGETLAGLL